MRAPLGSHLETARNKMSGTDHEDLAAIKLHPVQDLLCQRSIATDDEMFSERPELRCQLVDGAQGFLHVLH